MKSLFRTGMRLGQSRAKVNEVSRESAHAHSSTPLMMALEPRLMFDAALAAIAVEVVNKVSAPDGLHALAADTPAAPVLDRTTDSGANRASSVRHDIVFIDSQVSDIEKVAKAVPAGAEVVVLDANKDGFTQMATYLTGRHDIDSVSLISHGATGAVKAGSVWLTSQTLASHADALKTIGAALTQDGDFLLYGCRVGAGNEGQVFLDQIASLTSADVAASTDNTGATKLGGNWTLERSTGAITAPGLSAAALADYSSLLAAPVYETFDGVVLPHDGGQRLILSQGQSLIVNGWQISLTDRYGNVDAQSRIMVTNQSVDSGLADDNRDKAVLLLGSTSTPAAVIKSVNGEKFNLRSITVQNSYSSTSDFRLVGYRDGVQVNLATQDFTIGTYGTNDRIVELTGTAWQYVDEVRIVRPRGDADVSISIDDLNVSAGIAPNAPPVIGNLNGDTVTFTEKGGPVLLDAGLNATVTDNDSAVFTGGYLTVSIITNGVPSQDLLSIKNTGMGVGNIGVSGNNVYFSGTLIGTFSGGSGGNSLLVNFNANATPAAAQALIRSIVYNNNSSDPSTSPRTVRVTLNDGNVDGSSDDALIRVNVQSVNDAPTLTATPTNPGFTEKGSPVTLFSGASVSTIESGQAISALVFRVSNVTDGANEILTIDGSQVTLTHANFLTTINNGVSVSVSVTGGVATVTLAKSGGISVSATQTLLNSLSYKNSSLNPTAGSRVVSVTSIQDNGGTANGGSDSSLLSLSSSVTVTAVNDAPVLTTTGGSATFTAGDNATSTPVVIDAGLTLSDVDNTTLAFATVSITGNFRSAEDQLLFINNNSSLYGNISASYNAGTGVMTLTSAGNTASLAQWQAVLRSVRYTDTAVTPNTATRTISFMANDGTDNSTAATRTMIVNAVDQTPLLATSAGTGVFTEGQGAVKVDPGLTVSDLDNTTLATATVQITGNFRSGQDLLQFTNTNASLYGNIAAIYNTATGVLSLSSAGATATVAQWQAALREIYYSNSSGTPDTSIRTVSFSVSDGSKSSAVGTRNMNVVSVDIPPVLTVSGGSVTFTEGNRVPGTPVLIDSGLTVSDADSTTLANATVSITGNYQSGADVLAFVNTNASVYGNIAASYNAATGVLSLSSAGATATVAQWQAALRAITFTNTSDTPSAAARTVSFSINDGAVSSSTVTRTVLVVPVDDTPQLSSTAGTVVFVEADNAAPTPVVIDATLIINDPDSTAMASATVAITGNLRAGEDVLAFNNNNSSLYGNLVGSYNAATGVLSLSSAGGTATLAQWQAALRAVTYANTSERPDTSASRVISITVNDGNSISNTITRSIQVIETNDTPVIQIPGSLQRLQQDTVLRFSSATGNAISVSDADVGNGQLRVTLTVTQGRLSLSGNTGLSFTTGSGTGDATMTFTGTAADINAALQGLRFTPVTGYQGAVSITITTNDLGNSGGSAKSATSTLALSVDAVNVPTPVTPVPGGNSDGSTTPTTPTTPTTATVQPLPLAPVPSLGPAVFTATTPLSSALPSTAAIVPVTFGNDSFIVQPGAASGQSQTTEVLLARSTSLRSDPLDISHFVDASPSGDPLSLNDVARIQSRGLENIAGLGQYVVAPGQPVNIALPSEIISSLGNSGPLTVEIRLANGAPLPRWLRYDAVTGMLSGKAPAGLVQKVAIEIVVRDTKGARAVSHVDLEINANADVVPDTPNAQAPSAGRADLTQQFDRHGHVAREAERLLWLQHLAAAQAETA